MENYNDYTDIVNAENETTETKSKKSKKGLLVGLGVAAAAAGIIGGILYKGHKAKKESDIEPCDYFDEDYAGSEEEDSEE